VGLLEGIGKEKEGRRLEGDIGGPLWLVDFLIQKMLQAFCFIFEIHLVWRVD
jgi:hypothetical protein